MLYSILRVIVRLALKLYFRKIDISGIEHLKPGQAQILASNHPSGFLEPLLMACFFPRDLYFLVRGDVFKNRIARVLLEATHQIPIYRFKDGFSNLRNNADSIQAASSILIKKKCLLIFVEGGTESVKKLRPLQKGFVKLASETLQKENNLELEILPVGINFSDSTRAGSEVLIKIGTPVPVNHEQLNPGNARNPASANELLHVVHLSMKKNIIHLEDLHRSALLEWGLSMHYILSGRDQGRVVSHDDRYLTQCIHIANRLNELDEKEVQNLKQEVKSLDHLMKTSGIKQEDLARERATPLTMILLLLGLIPALIGLMFHFVPLFSAKTLAKKLAPSKEFFGSIWMVLSILFILLYYLIIVMLGIFGVLPWFTTLWAIPMGVFSHFYFSQVNKYQLRLPFGFGEIKKKSEHLYHHYFNTTHNGTHQK